MKATVSIKRLIPAWMVVAAIICMRPFTGLDRACEIAANKFWRVEIK